MKIFLLDTGISEKYDSKSNKIIRVNPQEGYDCDGHGTQIISIFDTHLSDQTIYVYKINFYKDRKLIYKSVIEGLELAAKYNPDVISMSIGIKAEFDGMLEKLIRKITNNGILVVAAADNEGALCAPARFPEVLSVIWDSNIVRNSEFESINHECIDLIGYGGTLQVKNNDIYETVGGSSFLVPLLIVKIYNIFSRIPSKKKIVEYFKNKTRSTERYFGLAQPNIYAKNIKKAIIFPVNKEVTTILNNIDLVKFQILGVYDTHFSSKIGKKVNQLLYQKDIHNFLKNQAIKALDDLDWEDEFDTVIVGHVKKISKLYKFDFLGYIKEMAKIYEKDVFSLDNVKNAQYSFCYDNNIAYGALNSFRTPVIAIVGTGSAQGKASLQLSLYREFKKEGYKSSVFMTEPYYELFGFSGWNNGYATNQNNWKYEILSINKIFRDVDKMKNDIVFVGTQSQILPSSRENLGFIPQESQNVLNAIPPDGIVLTVSSQTSKEYIERTCKYLESYYNVPVLAKYSITPENDNGQCYGPEDIGYLAKLIIEYFSKGI
ncbi:S8 family serine peptidase [Ligilactobacillus apodemi]|uniref:S8 family serine peptidase n=1 Tax=Ligilactobacillus apodemi TaxID=307126 RepID=UPI00214A968E|nr:S8 family serine peptidase [Ligilactobacillus apodemi]MCR1901407.1 S8 family serine peptidase [Ligilactobacillus apodemi]